MPDKDKKLTEDDAREVIAAAKRLFGNREDYNMADALKENWDDTQKRVADMDNELDTLPDFIGDVDVRVMQVGPNNTLTDVTDKVNPRDIRPDQLVDLKTGGAMSVPLGPDGRIDKEAALASLLRMTGGKGRGSQPLNTTDEAMRRMEVILARSDKMLDHFKD